MQNNNQQMIEEFFKYVQPLVSGSLGFIKTEGYLTHFPGCIVAMSADEMYCGIIHIPVIFNVYMTTEISPFLQLKTPESHCLENTYFIGNNLIGDKLMRYFQGYDNPDSKYTCIYQEPDCYNIPGFEQCIGNSSISKVLVTNGDKYYIVPASKSITQVSKGDTVSLRLYENPRSPIIKIARYTVYKKKFKLPVDIYSNILMA